jgi:hypothetical protein
LQRENLLLRNELNFELYLKEQHLRHIGRLHREKVTDTALEAERQNLYHTVRTLRTTNAAQHAELSGSAVARKRHRPRLGMCSGRQTSTTWTSEARELKAQAEEYAAKIATLTQQVEESGAQLFELQIKVTDTALEAERQNLYHTVRTLRTTNAAQHAELELCRAGAEAASTKARHVQWEADLNKLRAYREERKASTITRCAPWRLSSMPLRFAWFVRRIHDGASATCRASAICRQCVHHAMPKSHAIHLRWPSKMAMKAVARGSEVSQSADSKR